MNLLSFIAVSCLLTLVLAEQTATVTVVEKPESTFTLVQHQATAASAPSSTTLATSTRSPTPTSVVQATRHQTYTAIASASGGGGYSSYGSNAVDTDGGASGAQSTSFTLSKGALIAVIVVVTTVAVFGIASVVLYILAKRRQWNIRQSIKRASRRLTGRGPPPSKRDEAARRKRSGILAGSRTEGSKSAGSKSNGVRAAHPPGQKRAVVVSVKDEEKGPLDYGTPPATKQPKWHSRLWGNDWK